MVVVFYVLRISHELEAWVVPTVIARWEMLTEHARHLMHVMMDVIVDDLVDAGGRNFISRLVGCSLDFFDRSHVGSLYREPVDRRQRTTDYGFALQGLFRGGSLKPAGRFRGRRVVQTRRLFPYSSGTSSQLAGWWNGPADRALLYVQRLYIFVLTMSIQNYRLSFISSIETSESH